MRSTPNANIRIGSRLKPGFTVAELLVANVVMATALLGVYALFQQVLEAEAVTSRRWEEQASADAIASHLAAALEQAVNLPPEPAIATEADPSQTMLAASLQDRLYWCSSSAEPAPTRRRYEWQTTETAPGSLQARTIVYSGTKNLAGNLSADELADGELWSLAAPVTIARQIRALSVECRSLDAPASWQSSGTWPAGQVAIKIRAQVGDQTIERIVVPRVNADLLNAEAN